MAKKKKGKVIQMLSPENYIRQKARSLPIHECWVNTSWKEDGLANITISRRHTNNNLTVGIFLADINCLGIKDTHYFFNISPIEYDDLLDQIRERMDLEKADYTLAHNIIFAAFEYAEEYGFKPHKDFSLTKYILEEDTNDIELIDIECGYKGKPFYMRGPSENIVKANQIVAQLMKTAGPGNFDYMLNLDDDHYDDVDEYENEDEDDDEYENNEYQFDNYSLDEKRSLFEAYITRLEELGKDEYEYFFRLNQSITNDLIDIDKYNEYFEDFDSELSKIITDNETIPDEILGVEPGGTSLSSEVKEKFFEILSLEKTQKEYKKQLAKFRKNQGVEAATAYLDLIYTEIEKPENYESMLKACAEKYPCYNLVQMRLAEIDAQNTTTNDKYLYNNLFKDRNSIHSLEYFNYLHMRTMQISWERNLEKLEAWKDVMFDYIEKEIDFALLQGKIILLQINQVANKLKIKI
ncbi:MAG: hypothetical protein JW798_17155 [Prolixibacteraceae bacterium]|nr:hypothetical protein [Prolixibacteraceae bacterium]